MIARRALAEAKASLAGATFVSSFTRSKESRAALSAGSASSRSLGRLDLVAITERRGGFGKGARGEGYDKEDSES